MNKELSEKLQLAGISAGSACRRLMGRKDLFFKYLDRFARESEFDKLDQAFRENDCDKAFRAAHSLRGSAGFIGADDMHDILVEITEGLRSGDLEGNRERFIQLAHARQKIVEAVRDLQL